jgi:hypothetical protein
MKGLAREAIRVEGIAIIEPIRGLSTTITSKIRRPVSVGAPSLLYHPFGKRETRPVGEFILDERSEELGMVGGFPSQQQTRDREIFRGVHRCSSHHANSSLQSAWRLKLGGMRYI